MAKEREVFIYGQTDENGNIEVPGCIRNGIDEKSANKIFDEMSEFAKYAFNKSHAACYAVVSYQTAYLKCYYPSEFMAAMLNSYLGNLDKVPVYIEECKALNIEILKPDINISGLKFTVDSGNIRFGLGSIKNVGIEPINIIVKERNENGIYKSFTDFCERIAEKSVNKKCIESLIKAGAFDSFGKTRATLLESYEEIIDLIVSSNKKALEGQFSMFDFNSESTKNNLDEIKYKYNEQEEFSEKELLSQEKEMLGIYLTGHPLLNLKEEIEKQTTISSKDILAIDSKNIVDMEEKIGEVEISNLIENQKSVNYKDGQEVIFAGIITAIKKKFTKTNKIMAFITIEDLYGQIEVLAFENAYLNAKDSLVEENIVLIKGRLSIRDDEKTTIIANNIKNFGTQKRNMLTINITNLDEKTKVKLRGAIKYFNGAMNNIAIEVEDEKNTLKCGAIYLTEEIYKLFQEIVGEENIKINNSI